MSCTPIFFYRKNKRHYSTWTQANMEEALKASRQELWGLSGVVKFTAVLGGSFVTTAWFVLTLQMEETVSRYGG
jgi:hypothetical protein